MASVTPIRELRRRADGAPTQDQLWTAADYDFERWCWVVMVRTNFSDGWTEWVADWEKPNHFRIKHSADFQMMQRQTKEKRKCELGLLEFKIEPKFLGFVPDGDEAWIA